MHHPFLLILWYSKPDQGESKSNNLVIEHFISISVWSTHFLSTKASRQVTLQSVHSLIQNALWICRCVHLSMQHAPTHSCMHPHAHRWLNKSNLYAMSKEATHTQTLTHSLSPRQALLCHTSTLDRPCRLHATLNSSGCTPKHLKRTPRSVPPPYGQIWALCSHLSMEGLPD